MNNAKPSSEIAYFDCTECLNKTERTKQKQARIFILSFFSLGILTPIAILIALVMQLDRFNICSGCREVLKEERIAKKVQ